jgi:hypothetical protein
MEPVHPRTPSRVRLLLALMGLAVIVIGTYAADAWTAVPVRDDPLVRMPGTQPGTVALESPNRCLNCHAGYNSAVEPGFNWQGSMMAHSARDPLFFAAMTVAQQDSIWAIGTPNAGDLCLRCHFPGGWLGGRSDPTNASLMIGADWDGVQCDFCHSMWNPFFAEAHADSSQFWDETNASGTPSDAAAAATLQSDAGLAAAIEFFNGDPFFAEGEHGLEPVPTEYQEATSGQYFVTGTGEKRASFADAEARHQTLYSRFHKSKYYCATCHDVSNPVLANLTYDNDPAGGLWSETNTASSYFHVERTFSEFMLSAYGQDGGSAGIGPFAPSVFETSQPGNVIAMCQDCHMRDEVGTGADKRGVPIRPNDSVEHPESGQPLHDLTGGNVWISQILASAVVGSPNYDATNAQLLGQGPAVLTLDLAQGLGIDPVALLAGADRAAQQLQLAASIENVSYNAGNGELTFRIQNQTGHRLISGFPEGRRMFVNIKAYDGAGNVVFEVNPYDPAAGTLKGLTQYTYDGQGLPDPTVLGAEESYVDALVYEMHPSSSLTDEAETFHFVLADGRYKDNRIPPKGFRIDEAAERQSVPVWHGVEDPSYFTAAEYAGGYDEVSLTIVPGATSVEISLYYQTTSREYIEFLRDQINGTAGTLAGEGAYLIQTDPFFSGLRAWGDTIWNLWTHNMTDPGGAPFLMTSAFVGGEPPPPPGQPPTVPTLTSATPGHTQVTLAWSDEHSSNADLVGYTVYRDQAGKKQLVATTGPTTTFTDTGLTNGQEYCYAVTSRTASLESGFSNILCAIPNNAGHAEIQVASVQTGRWETTGKGKNKTTTFVPTTTFAQGDGVVVLVEVVDGSTGLPVSNAVVDLAVTGPQSLTLTTGPSDAEGIAQVTWTTESPSKRGRGGTPAGSYLASTTGVTASGYTWDGVQKSVTFSILL